MQMAYTEDKKAKLKYTSLGGIYKVECTKTNSVYIGQSICIDNRLTNHRQNLRSGKHVVSDMQTDFKKHGEQYFVFEAIHFSDEQNLLTLETFYIGEYKRLGYIIYNSVKKTDSLSIVQCDKENKAILQKISDLLDEGKISKQELEQAVYFKQSF